MHTYSCKISTQRGYSAKTKAHINDSHSCHPFNYTSHTNIHTNQTTGAAEISDTSSKHKIPTIREAIERNSERDPISQNNTRQPAAVSQCQSHKPDRSLDCNRAATLLQTRFPQTERLTVIGHPPYYKRFSSRQSA